MEKRRVANNKSAISAQQAIYDYVKR